METKELNKRAILYKVEYNDRQTRQIYSGTELWSNYDAHRYTDFG